MFEALSDKLKKVLKDLRGESRLSPEHLDLAMREILGGTSSRLLFTSRRPNSVMIVGLQGSGKTTSTGKLAKWLYKNQDRNPLLLSVDVYRPAAREQLAVIGKAISIPVFAGDGIDDPIELCRAARLHCEQVGFDTLMIDTAGRLHIDDALMEELQRIKAEMFPVETLFVADAMTGQDAVKSAKEFHDRVGVTGVILTKMDGDARGGAALSIKEVTGQPIKFVGVGEKYDALDPFYPERIHSRRFPRPASTDEEARLGVEPSGDAARRHVQRHAEDDPRNVGADGKGNEAHGGDHQLDDARRARESFDHQRAAPPPHRDGQRQ